MQKGVKNRERNHFALCTLHFALPAYTLVELFLTLAVLMILLGMMNKLATRVRRASAEKVTRQILARLTVLMDQYQRQYDALPPVTPVVSDGQTPVENNMPAAALANDADVVRYLGLKNLGRQKPQADDPLLRSLQLTGAGVPVVLDPWGSPVVFMPRQHPAIGMAPDDACFFFSAGPDKLFLTREDNVYSYEGNGIPANGE